MKKYGIFIFYMILLLLCFTLALAGCAKNKPEKIVENELNLIQELDESAIKAFISYEDMMNSSSAKTEVDAETTKAIKLFFKDFHYRLISCSATGRTATVNVEITNLDAKALAKDLCKELIKQSITGSQTKITPPATNSYFALLSDILSTHQYELVTTTAHFELVKTDHIWSIQSTATLEDELVGGFITYLNDSYLIKPEEVTALVLEMFQSQTPAQWVSYLEMNDVFSTGSSIYKEVDLALASQIAEHFHYTVKSVTQEDSTATATLELTSLDMESVLTDYLDKLMQYAATTEAIRTTDAQLADKTAALLIDSLKANKKSVQKTVSIHFLNNGITWEMQLGNQFTDVFLGNLQSAIDTFQAKSGD